MPGDHRSLIAPIFTTDELIAATSDRAWLQALLDVEVALAEAEAEVGLIPVPAATAIAQVATLEAFDTAELGQAARLGGNPVIPLVAALRERVGVDVAADVHRGATSQDIIDTAMVVLIRRTAPLIGSDLGRAADACARLASDHRATAMLGRTLLQPAVPITFGLTAAGWMIGLDDAHRELDRAVEGLTAQLGGAAGTMADLGPSGPAVLAGLARRLHLPEPVLPWHTARQRTAVVASALGVAAGTAAKLSGDVALLMQAEVGEAAEPVEPGRGGSSAMTYKRNPVLATEAIAAADRAMAIVPLFLRGLTGEHQRPLATWHVEWSSIADLLALAGGAVARGREVAEGLTVDAERMRANLAKYGHGLSVDLDVIDALIARALAARAEKGTS